jgi:hypothetical protein
VSKDLTSTVGFRGPAPAHDKGMAAKFLAGLDPNATRFTFQFFSDGPKRYAEVLNGTLDEVWPKVQEHNTPERLIGAFVTINETDFRGRRTENILRPRALFVDADGDGQAIHCLDAIKACGAAPSMIVQTGRGIHVYWICSDIPLDQFSALQENLIKMLGTDAAVKDLPRVMRLPGTLHLKNPADPRLVKLSANDPLQRWQFSELVAKLGLLLSAPAPASDVVPLNQPQWPITVPVPSALAGLPHRSLAEGLEPNLEEIRSAVTAIPASAITAEPEWVKLARALAHTAAVFQKLTEPLWAILDEASRLAPGYERDENRRRYERYISEALTCGNPITLGTLYHFATTHGWQRSALVNSIAISVGPIGSPNAAAGSIGPAVPTSTRGLAALDWANSATGPRAVHVSSLPLIPPKRQWLHGTDLVRGAVTVLVAAGGRAKSTWLLACALACASGRDLLRSHVFGGPLRVLCLSTEDGRSELALRLRAAMRHYGLADTDAPGLFIIGADSWGLPLLRADGNRAILDRDGLAALMAELDYTKPDVLIIDPLITIMGGVSANENAAAALLMGQLASLAAKQGIAVALAHHAAKGRDPASAESAMGAASFVNLARVALAIEPLDEKNAGEIGLPPWEAKSVFRLIGTKQNFAPPNTKDRWFRLVSIDMSNAQPPVYMNGDQVGVVESFQPGVSTSAFPYELVRDALLAVDGASPPLSPSKRSSDRYAAPVIADAIARHRNGQASEIEGKAVLDHLMRVGLVAVKDVTLSRPGSRADVRKGLIPTPAGKAVIDRASQGTLDDPIPQSPQTPATTLQDAAGGDAPASPATQGGCGGNAGAS